MTHTVIIYCSKTGFSQRYAQWLAEDTGAEILPYHRTIWTHLIQSFWLAGCTPEPCAACRG